MTTLRRFAPVVALATAMSTGHFVYPAWLALTSRRRPQPSVPELSSWPAVTVLVPAHKEAGVIADKIGDARSNGYPGQLDVLVVADGDEVTAQRAREAGATVLSTGERRGKSRALNLGFSKVSTPVVIMSDANTKISAGAIAAMVRHLDVPDIGAVAGEKSELARPDDDQQGVYWRFESWLKQMEWRLGSTVGLDGALAAIRTAAWRPIPEDIATDDLWIAFDLGEQGYRIAYEPSAKSYEPPPAAMRQEWERRTRIASGALHVFVRRKNQLGIGAGLLAKEMWGHRLARYTIAPLAHLSLVVVAARCRRSSRLARLFLLGHGVAGAALGERIATPDRRRGPLTSLLSEGLFLQLVALGGIVRYLRGDRRTMWPRVER